MGFRLRVKSLINDDGSFAVSDTGKSKSQEPSVWNT